jgi:hypothetical protein
MLNNLLLKSVIGTGSLFLSAFAIADSPSSMTKDDFLGQLKNNVATSICKSFTENDTVNKQLIAVNINYDKCVSLIPASYDKCQSQLYGSIPATIDKDSAEKWGNSIGECIGADFAGKYLVAAPAASTTPGTTSSAATITKDAWLGSLKVAVPNLLCQGFLQDASIGKQMATRQLTMEKCVSLIPASFDKCQAQLYSSIPATLDDKSAATWGNSLGECIGKDFAIKYLI